MEIKDIEKLARLMQETGLTALEYAQGEPPLRFLRPPLWGAQRLWA